jgi:membrane protease subunit (stomatin/prohibitin family)
MILIYQICNAGDSQTDHADDGQADDGQADEKGDIITCLECCDGEFCNDRGCGTKGKAITIVF